MRTNKSLCTGFANFVSYVAEVLNSGQPPTIAQLIDLSSREWPPSTRNFFQRGGMPISAALACFELALIQDKYLGDGAHRETLGDEIEKLPEHRNDREFVFAQRQLGVLQGLLAEDSMRV